jgi:RND family efflux transporter MFP subunit
MIKKIINGGLILSIIMAGISGCRDFKNNKGEMSTIKKQPIQNIRVEVKVDTAKIRTLYMERKILGTLTAYRETELAPVSMTSVRVKYFPFKIGDYVQQGQIVAKMDDAQYVSTSAQFATIKSQYERTKALYEENAISKAQFEQIESQYLSLKRQLENLEENTILRAPFSGIITAKSVEEGELYSASMGMTTGSKGLVKITQLNPLKLDLDVDDQTVKYIKRGMMVRVAIDNNSDSNIVNGKIDWVNPVANSLSRTFGVRIIIENPDKKFLPGYFAVAHILINKKENCISVPKSAVVDDYVYVIKDNVAIAKKVETGLITEDFVEIISGIKAGDIVAVSGNKALPDSAIVDISAN